MASIEADVRTAITTFKWNEAQLTTLLRGPEGPVVRDTVRRAIRVEGLAKEHATHRPGPMVRTGRLRGSITWRLGVDALGVYADVGTAVLYGYFLEHGTANMPKYPFLAPALEAARF